MYQGDEADNKVICYFLESVLIMFILCVLHDLVDVFLLKTSYTAHLRLNCSLRLKRALQWFSSLFDYFTIKIAKFNKILLNNKICNIDKRMIFL